MQGGIENVVTGLACKRGREGGREGGTAVTPSTKKGIGSHSMQADGETTWA